MIPALPGENPGGPEWTVQKRVRRQRRQLETGIAYGLSVGIEQRATPQGQH